MKVLCPVDFSIASVDAVYYAIGLMKKFHNPQIELLHCSFPGDVSTMFDEYVEKQRLVIQENLSALTEKVVKEAPEIKWSQQIIHGNPLDEIYTYLKKHDFDIAIIGTKGLQNKEDRLFGSITESLFEKSKTAILAVPQGYVFDTLNSVVFSIDDDSISSEKIMLPLISLVKQYKSSLKLLHIKENEDRPLEYNLDLDYFLKGINYEYYSKSTDNTLTKAISEVCRHEAADLLCMVHRDRGWVFNLIHRSQVKEELDELSMPILILHD
jgi:nucleotide-binding universal stress UspA family protein